MPIVRALDRSMIEHCLRSDNLRFLRDNDGDFRVEFGYDEETGCEVTFSLSVVGPKSEVYSIVAFSDRRVPTYEWDRALRLCNQWNEERRWPKAYLYMRDNIGNIILEQQIDLEEGIHQELLDDFTRTAIVSSIQFWRWAHQEQGF